MSDSEEERRFPLNGPKCKCLYRKNKKQPYKYAHCFKCNDKPFRDSKKSWGIEWQCRCLYDDPHPMCLWYCTICEKEL